MKTKTFKNLEELKPYFNKKNNTYIFTKFDLVIFEFDLVVNSNINAYNIKADDINAYDINALDINAGDISYYGVCFAYKNIKCKSIKGIRKNHKHFALDGKIEVLENEQM